LARPARGVPKSPLGAVREVPYHEVVAPRRSLSWLLQQARFVQAMLPSPTLTSEVSPMRKDAQGGIPSFAWSLTAFVFLACGGEAIVDRAEGGGGSGAASTTSSSTTTTSSSTSTTNSTTSSCDCVNDDACPIVDDACFYFACDECLCQQVPLPTGTVCMSGVCDGAMNCVECLGPSDCPPGYLCVEQACVPSTEAVCDQVCGQLEACLGPSPECPSGCAEDLADCSGSEIEQVSECGWLFSQSCNVDVFVNCMSSISCINI
jgi:hypothetical protein